MRNIERLIALRGALVADKKHHDQETWAKVKLKFPKGARRIEVDCATSACAAGHTCLLAGDRFVIEERDLEHDDKGRPYYHASVVRTPEGEECDLEARARGLLGLAPDEAEELFLAFNSHKETIKLLDRLIAGENIVDEDED